MQQEPSNNQKDDDNDKQDLFLGIRHLAECYVGVYEYHSTSTPEKENFFSSVLNLNSDGTFSLSGSIKTKCGQIMTTLSGKWEIQQRQVLDLRPFQMSLKQIYKTCQLLLRTEQKSIERDDFSIINDDSTILYREGRLVDVNTGLVTINDDTFGNKVSLQGIPERIALQLEILHTPFGSFNLNTFKIEMKNIIDSAHAPSDAFNNLKKTLIQIEYKIFLFNRAAEALKSLLILGDLWMEKFHRNPNKDFVNLITHIVTQSFEALYRLKESDDIFELVQEFKQSILRWEQKGSEYLHQDPFWNEQIPQMKFTIDLLANEHVPSEKMSLQVENEETESFSQSSPVEESTNMDVEAIKQSEEYQRLQKLVEEQKQWIHNRVQELIHQIETNTYPFKKTKLLK